MASPWSEQMTGTEDAAADHTHAETGEMSAAGDFILSAEGVADGVAESVAGNPIPSAKAEVQELPSPLRQLIATAGVNLVAVPCGTWKIDGYAAKLRRPLSETFSIDSVVNQ